MKSIFITGSTDGIGKLAALNLAKLDYTLIVHGRNQEKLNDTINQIKHDTQNENIIGVKGDLSSFKEIDEILKFLENAKLSIHVLINNAGVFKTSQAINDQGLDNRFMVNYIAPYILTNELIKKRKQNRIERIINLSSAAQEHVSLSALKGEMSLSDQSAYAQSKLALTMWSMHLSKSESDLITIPVNPGSLLNTNMVREAYGRFWSPPDKGADILVSLATEDQYEGASGKYFDNDLGNPKGTFGQAHSDAFNEEMITQLLIETDSIISKYRA